VLKVYNFNQILKCIFDNENKCFPGWMQFIYTAVSQLQRDVKEVHNIAIQSAVSASIRDDDSVFSLPICSESEFLSFDETLQNSASKREMLVQY
jgi:hypothetical protein